MPDTTPTTTPTSAHTNDGTATPAGPVTTEQPTPATPEATAPTDEATADADEDGGAEDAERWKRRSREWERRAKRNADLAARYPDLETRTTQLQEQYEEALGARTRIEAELWRERAARAHTIPDDLVEFLTGSSEAEVMQRAERLAAQLTGGQRRPLPDPTQGRGTPPSADPADAFATYVRGALNK
jgi:hypothetical protein